jgi:hypothetical protein
MLILKDLSSMYKYRNIQHVAVIFCELINPCYKFSVFVLNIDIYLDHLDKGTTAGHNNFSCIISVTFGQSTPFAAGNTTFGAAKPTGTAFGTPGGGVFGAATPTATPGGGLFVQQNTSTGGGSLFGSAQPQQTGFGQSAGFSMC